MLMKNKVRKVVARNIEVVVEVQAHEEPMAISVCRHILHPYIEQNIRMGRPWHWTSMLSLRFCLGATILKPNSMINL